METPSVKETADNFKRGLKQIPTRHTAAMVIGTLAGLVIGVMAMQALLGNKQSLTTYVYPSAPMPSGGY